MKSRRYLKFARTGSVPITRKYIRDTARYLLREYRRNHPGVSENNLCVPVTVAPWQRQFLGRLRPEFTLDNILSGKSLEKKYLFEFPVSKKG